MTKSKTSDVSKPSLRKRLMKRGLMFIGICVLSIGALVGLSDLYSAGQDIPSSPDPALLSTAEYLYEHPEPTPEGVSVNTHGTQTAFGVCYSTQDTSNWTQVFINKARVSLSSIQMSEGFPQLPPPMNWRQVCIDARQLNEGLHLVELQLKSNPWTIDSMYQWAVRVEG